MYKYHHVNQSIMERWQKTVDLLAKVFEVPAGLIMRVHEHNIEVLTASSNEGNPYEPGELAKLNTGLYCETVMAKREPLEVPNALEDRNWKDNPDIALNMISYFGIPLLWPDGSVFGTICVLDSEPRQFSEVYRDLLQQFKIQIESDFELMVQKERLEKEISERIQIQTQLEALTEDLETQVKKRTKSLVKANEDRETLERAIEQSPSSIVITDKDGIIEYVNPAFSSITGYSKSEAIGANPKILKSGYHCDEFYESMWLKLARGKVWEGEICNRKKNGELFWENARIAAVRNGGGEITHFIAVKDDDTERRSVIQHLKKELKVHSVLSELGSAILDVREELTPFLKVVFSHCLDLTGSELGLISIKDPATGNFEVQAKCADNPGRDFTEQGLSELFWSQFKSLMHPEILNRDRELPWMLEIGGYLGCQFVEQFLVAPILNDSTLKGIVLLGRKEKLFTNYDLLVSSQLVDLIKVALKQVQTNREKSELQRRLLQTQKMEAIGTLAGGIAHDFNNILAPILGYSEFLEECLEDEEELRDGLGVIKKSSLRAKELVSQILSIARQEEEKASEVSVQRLLKEYLKFSRSTFPSKIQIKQEIDTHCPAVFGDPTKVHQVLMNLITNARHAIGEQHGTIFVKLEEVRVSKNDGDMMGVSSGPFVQVTIEDSGCGMAPELLERIFEPYFSTKGKQEGTGLGLAICHGIVTSMGGTIQVTSEPDVGTTFRILFPVASSTHNKATSQKPKEYQRGTEHILIVDDELQVLKVEQKQLERLGYKVSIRSNGFEAWEAFQHGAESFDLIISDLAMPHIDGLELAQKILEKAPTTPIILTTGFSNNVDKMRAFAMGIRAVLEKPASIEVLSRTIRQIFDASDAPVFR